VGRFTLLTPAIAEPPIENDGDVRGLAKHRAEVVVDVPVSRETTKNNTMTSCAIRLDVIPVADIRISRVPAPPVSDAGGRVARTAVARKSLFCYVLSDG
jgi:hypothetical protein